MDIEYQRSTHTVCCNMHVLVYCVSTCIIIPVRVPISIVVTE